MPSRGKPKIPKSEKIKVFYKSKGKCRECGRKHRVEDLGEKWNVDHVVPRAKGGRDYQSNLALTCISCNSKKGDKMNVGDLIETTIRRTREADANSRNRQSGNKSRGQQPRNPRKNNNNRSRGKPRRYVHLLEFPTGLFTNRSQCGISDPEDMVEFIRQGANCPRCLESRSLIHEV